MSLRPHGTRKQIRCGRTNASKKLTTLTISLCRFVSVFSFPTCEPPPLRIIVYLRLLLTDGEFNDTPHIFMREMLVERLISWCFDADPYFLNPNKR